MLASSAGPGLGRVGRWLAVVPERRPRSEPDRDAGGAPARAGYSARWCLVPDSEPLLSLVGAPAGRGGETVKVWARAVWAARLPWSSGCRPAWALRAAGEPD